MSLDVEVELSCDGIGRFNCTTPAIFAPTGGEARQCARERGWLVSQPGGKDFCPDHKHLAKEATR